MSIFYPILISKLKKIQQKKKKKDRKEEEKKIEKRKIAHLM